MSTRVLFAAASLAVAVLATAAVVLMTPLQQAGAGTEGGAWQAPVEVDTGDAFRGPWRMNDSEFLYVDDPTVAMTDAADVGVAWARQQRKDIYFQRYDSDGKARLPDPINVSRSPDTFSWLPRMVFSADDPDRVYILWQEIIFSGGSHGGDIFFARSRDGGQSFSEPINLSNTTAGAGKGRLSQQRWHNGSLDLLEGPDGTLHAAWTEYEGALRVSRSTDGGKSFSDPVHVAGGDGAPPTRGPSIAVDGDTVYLAWAVGEDRQANIHLATSNDGGESFGETRVAHESAGHADAPRIAVDGNGTLHLVYAESPEGPWRRYHIKYTHSANDELVFQEPRPIHGANEGRFDSVHFPALHLDGDGRLYVLSELYPDARGRPLGLGLVTSTDGGETFSSPTILPGSDNPELGFNGSLQGLLMNKLAVNTAGDIAVVNSYFKEGDTSRVWLFRTSKPAREQ